MYIVSRAREKKQMFAICPRKVFENSDLSAIDIRVYIVLQGFADREGRCFPLIKTIAKACGVCERTIFRSLKKLEEMGEIKREMRFRADKGRGASYYYLNLQPVPDNDVTPPLTSESVPPDKDVILNNNAVNNNIFINKNTARACTHAREGGENAAELSKKAKQTLELEDLRDVKDCLEEVPAAADYKFFKTQDGVIGCRPSWKFAQDVETEKRIRRFFEFTAKRDIWIAKFGEFSIDEININFESEV